jgi:hypothetical protein
MTTGAEVAVRRPQASTLPAKIQYARALADSGLLPAAFRDKPANVLWAMEYADMLGLAPMVAMTGIHVIEGKPTASAGLISGLVRKARHKLRVTGDDNHAVAEITRCDDPDFTFRSEWTLERAKQAELLGKANWRKYPAAMLKARAITEAARDACEEALYGLQYTPEELGAEVDEDGVVVAEVVDDPQPQGEPAGDPWYVRPAPEQAAAEEWTAAALRVIPDIGLDACRKLWREAVEKVRTGELLKPEAETVLTPLQVRMEALAGVQQDAEATTPAEAEAEPIEGKVVDNYGLDPDDDWSDKVADITRPEHADAVITEAGDLLRDEAMTPERYGQVSTAVELRLAEIGGEQAAA